MLGNREIKFRQYEAMYGVMIQWEGEPDGPSEAHQQGLKEAISQYGWDALYNGSIFMQYTGLKDSFGKEIYEGDIINRTHSAPNHINDFVGVVRYLEGQYWIVGNEELYEVASLFSEADENEVIGNIYEHPHLLKEVNNNAQTK